MYFKIILKVTKNQVVNLSLEDTLFEKQQREGQFDPQPLYKLGLTPLLTYCLKMLITKN